MNNSLVPRVVFSTNGDGGIVNHAAIMLEDTYSPPGLAGVIKRERSGVGVDEGGAAVVVRNAEKWYKKDQPVLNGLNMTVPVANVYALLGSSGCGKTTLLSCITGQRKLNRGRVWVFGGRPGEEGIGVPGRNVGYMPQDISLYMELSVAEVIRYFGILGGITGAEVVEKQEFLRKLLDLPGSTRKIGGLSGGQQRRVSFAAALIHSPELLILDEPTSGVDALLRKKIWEYLGELVCKQRTTVIITTHYIEEAKQADVIGVMRGGRLLVEKSPAQLLTLYRQSSLENVVLQLCTQDEAAKTNSFCITTGGNDERSVKMAKVLRKPEHLRMKDSFARINALTRKNLAVVFRNVILLVFVTTIAAVILVGLCFAFGTDPEHLHVGVVNNEFSPAECLNLTRVEGECQVELLSCQYLSSIDDTSVDLIHFETESDAVMAVHKGQVWGYIRFPPSFSENLWERASSGPTQTDESSFNASDIVIRMDKTNKQIGLFLEKTMYDAFLDFIRVLLANCGFDPRQGESVFKFEDPIFGKDNTDFREYLAPTTALGLLYFFALVPSSIRVITEKKSGVMERTVVAGAQTWEIMVAYFISEFLVLAIQSGLCFCVITYIFEIKVKGSEIYVLILFLLSGYAGVSMGFLLGTICTEEVQAAMLAIATFFPTFILGGMFWPVEGLLYGLKYVALVGPLQIPTESVRSVISRGWEFSHPSVWPGFAVLGGYICGYMALTGFCYKYIKRQNS